MCAILFAHRPYDRHSLPSYFVNMCSCIPVLWCTYRQDCIVRYSMCMTYMVCTAKSFRYACFMLPLARKCGPTCISRNPSLVQIQRKTWKNKEQPMNNTEKHRKTYLFFLLLSQFRPPRMLDTRSSARTGIIIVIRDLSAVPAGDVAGSLRQNNLSFIRRPRHQELVLAVCR